MKTISSRAFAVVAIAAALSACGGDDDLFDDGDPTVTAIPAQILVTASTDLTLSGSYATQTIALNRVTKVNPIGGEPETCRFRFSGLKQGGSDRLMDGDIRYIPGTNELRVTFISIAGKEYRLQGTAGASVDKANNEIDYNTAVLTSTQGTGETVTLFGSIPMRTDRPEGC